MYFLNLISSFVNLALTHYDLEIIFTNFACHVLVTSEYGFYFYIFFFTSVVKLHTFPNIVYQINSYLKRIYFRKLFSSPYLPMLVMLSSLLQGIFFSYLYFFLFHRTYFVKIRNALVHLRL